MEGSFNQVVWTWDPWTRTMIVIPRIFTVANCRKPIVLTLRWARRSWDVAARVRYVGSRGFLFLQKSFPRQMPRAEVKVWLVRGRWLRQARIFAQGLYTAARGLIWLSIFKVIS